MRCACCGKAGEGSMPISYYLSEYTASSQGSITYGQTVSSSLISGAKLDSVTSS